MTDFQTLLQQAFVSVNKAFPGSSFYEADAAVTGTVASPDQVTSWTFWFNDGQGVISITATDGVLGAPVRGGFLWDDLAVGVPVPLSPDEAWAAANAAKYDAPIAGLALRHILHYEDEPTYVFTLPSLNLWVFVGVYSNDVTTESMAGGRALPRMASRSA